MKNATQPTSDAVYLRAKPSVLGVYFLFVGLAYFVALLFFSILFEMRSSFWIFAGIALMISSIFPFILCYGLKPHVVADHEGVRINTDLRRRKITWPQIKEVEWRAFERRVPGALGATYVVGMNPVFKGYKDNDLAVINFALWGRDETEQGTFIEFVGQRIEVNKK